MALGEVRLTGRLICACDAEAEIVRHHLADHLCLTRAEPGCLAFHVAPTEDPLVWHVEERFIDREASARHQSRTRASAWGHATQGIGREYQVFGLD